jgi:7-carboxy-7-deazaguanine synthase
MPQFSVQIPVHETFQQTIQGEGFWAGAAVDFIRLHGCPVGCSWCDTGYSPTDGRGRSAPRLMRSISDLVGELRSPRVVISGGEPFMHKHLPLLVDAIAATGRHVSIETSGAYWQPISDAAWVTLSPKQHVSPNYQVNPVMWLRADEIKLVICHGNELDRCQYQPFLSCANVTKTRFLQPEWTDHHRTLPLVLEMIRQNPDYRLSLQSHKTIGVK